MDKNTSWEDSENILIKFPFYRHLIKCFCQSICLCCVLAQNLIIIQQQWIKFGLEMVVRKKCELVLEHTFANFLWKTELSSWAPGRNIASELHGGMNDNVMNPDSFLNIRISVEMWKLV